MKWCGFPPRGIDEAAFIDLVESDLLGYDIGVRAGNQLQYACEGGLGIDASRNPLTCGAAQWVAPYPDCIGQYRFTIFSCASAKAERSLSRLSCVWMYVDQNKVNPPRKWHFYWEFLDFKSGFGFTQKINLE